MCDAHRMSQTYPKFPQQSTNDSTRSMQHYDRFDDREDGHALIAVKRSPNELTVRSQTPVAHYFAYRKNCGLEEQVSTHVLDTFYLAMCDHALPRRGRLTTSSPLRLKAANKSSLHGDNWDHGFDPNAVFDEVIGANAHTNARCNAITAEVVLPKCHTWGYAHYQSWRRYSHGPIAFHRVHGSLTPFHGLCWVCAYDFPMHISTEDPSFPCC